MSKASWIGQTISGRYEIQELLGQGGMSAVYKANDPNLRRVVAIKLIHAHLSSNEEFVRRFEEEAASVAQLRHPNLIQVYDFNNDQDTYYIVFEFVPGETIQARLKRMQKAGRPMDVAEAVDIAAKSADGLQYAHVKGLIHRDIKPANIILNVQGQPIITDFGIAKIMGGTQHTATGAVLGTARYMSPEQIKGERIGPRTDIYSLGVTLFEMLGGRPPFESDSAMTLMMMHMTDPVPNLHDLRSDIPPALVQVVNKALAKDAKDRYETASEMASALRNLDSASQTAGMTVVETGPKAVADPGATVLESAAAGMAGAAVSDTGPATGPQESASSAAPPPPPASTGQAPAGTSGQPPWLYIAGGALIVLLLLLGIWALFLRDSGGGEQPPVAGGLPETTPVVIATEEATDEPTEEPAATEPPQPTDEPTQEPATATAEPLPEGPTGTIGSTDGTVVMYSPDGQQSIVDENSVISAGTQLVTTSNSQVTFTLEDDSIIQIAGISDVTVENLAQDPQDSTQESLFRLVDGNILLRQPETGNALTITDQDGNILGTLQDSSVAAIRGSMARRLQQTADQGVMAVSVTDEGARVSCFAGDCFLDERQPLAPGQEVILDLEDGQVVEEMDINRESGTFILWDEACNGCLTPLAPPQVEPTLAPTDVPPTPEPTATDEPEQEQLSVQITGISLQNGTYVVSYETYGYTETLPGQHVHFYFDTVSEANAGVPGSGPWILYGGPRPFTGYSEGDRPGGASSMCARVANADHSIIYGSGNCYPLP